MKEIPIKLFARQSLSIMLEQSLYEISLKECNGIMAATIIRDGVTIIENRRVCAGMCVIPEGYLETGNFIILTDSGEIPYYTRFESTDVMVYLTLEEVVTMRATLFEGPSVNSIPSGPLTNFNYIGGKLSDGLLLTRASIATYIKSGSVVNAAANVARFEDTGLLLETAATNLLTYSGTLSNAIWVAVAGSKTANQAAPDGGTGAIKFIPNTTSTTHYVSQLYKFTPGETYTYTIFIKAGEYKFAAIQLGNYTYQVDPQAVNIDLTTGEITANDPSRIAIKNVGNGWFRVKLTCTVLSNPPGTVIQCQVYARNAILTSTFAGDGTSGIYIWGGQLEVGTTETSYIPTTTVAVTRAADVLSLTQSGAQTVYRKITYKTGVVEQGYYGMPLVPVGFNGWLQELKAWNRELTDAEK